MNSDELNNNENNQFNTPSYNAKGNLQLNPNEVSGPDEKQSFFTTNNNAQLNNAEPVVNPSVGTIPENMSVNNLNNDEATNNNAQLNNAEPVANPSVGTMPENNQTYNYQNPTNGQPTNNKSFNSDKKKLIIYILVPVVVIIIGLIIAFAIKNPKTNNNNSNNNNNSQYDNYDDHALTGENNNFSYKSAIDMENDVIVIAQNNNPNNLDVTVEIEFYDANEILVGSDNEFINVVESGAKFAVRFTAPENYDHYKIYFDIKNPFYLSYKSKLQYTDMDNGKNIVVQIKNNLNETIRNIDAAIIYYKNDKIIGYDEEFESNIESGRSANFSFHYPHDKDYNEIKYDKYEIYINQASVYSE